MSLKDPAAKELLANFAYANSLLSYYLGTHISAFLDKNVNNKRIYVWTGTHFSTDLDDLARLINERDETITQLPHWEELVALILASRKNYWTGTNASHHLLNCQNGVVNMLTGELLPHNPVYRFDYVLPAGYHPDANEEDLNTASRNLFADHQDLFHMAAGYTLSSSTEEGVHFFVFDNQSMYPFFSFPLTPILPYYSKKRWIKTNAWVSNKQWFPVPLSPDARQQFIEPFFTITPEWISWIMTGYQKYANNGFRLPPRSFMPENYPAHLIISGEHL